MFENECGELTNCPVCDSDLILVLSGRDYIVKCGSCYQIRLQGFSNESEAKEMWNKLFSK